MIYIHFVGVFFILQGFLDIHSLKNLSQASSTLLEKCRPYISARTWLRVEGRGQPEEILLSGYESIHLLVPQQLLNAYDENNLLRLQAFVRTKPRTVRIILDASKDIIHLSVFGVSSLRLLPCSVHLISS